MKGTGRVSSFLLSLLQRSLYSSPNTPSLGLSPQLLPRGPQAHTASVGVGSVGKPPDISQTHAVADTRQQEVQLARPVAPVCCKVHIQVHITLVTGSHQQVWGDRLPGKGSKTKREEDEVRVELGTQAQTCGIGQGCMGDALSVQIIKWFHLNARGSSLEIFRDQQGSSDLRKLSGFILASRNRSRMIQF